MALKGRIVSFRRGRHTIRHNQVIIAFETIDSKEKASQLQQKTVVFKTKAKTLKGVVTATHGSKGLVRVVFNQGLSPRCIGEQVFLE